MRSKCFFRVTLICQLFILVGANIYAQSNYADSILGLINKETTGSKKIMLWQDLLSYTSKNQADNTAALADKAITLAKKLKDSVFIASIIRYKGIAMNTLGNKDSALYYYYQSIAILERHHDDQVLASLYNDVGRHNRHDNPIRAIAYYDKAMAIYKALEDSSGMATIYNESGVAYEIKGDFAEAEQRYKSSLAISSALHDSVGISYSLSFLSSIAAAQKKYAESEELALQTLAIRQNLKDSFSLAIAITNLGELYNLTGRFAKATEQFVSSNKIAEAIGFLELAAHNYGQLSEASEKSGNYKEALRFKNNQNQIRDSVFQIAKTKQIEELSTKYETAEKEKQIQQQEFEIRRKNLSLLTISALLLSGIIAVYYNFRRRQLRHKQQLEKERMLQQEKATKAVMQAEEYERRRLAAELHDGVGQILSAARMNLSAFESDSTRLTATDREKLAKVMGLVDESCNEVRSVSHSMMPGALLKKGLAFAIEDIAGKIDSSVMSTSFYAEGLDERLDTETESMLYRIVQEVINNVLKHSHAKSVDISMVCDDDGIQIMVEDDGQGFDASLAKEEGIGLKNIASRVQYLKGSLEINSVPGKGTVVAIHIPAEILLNKENEG